MVGKLQCQDWAGEEPLSLAWGAATHHTAVFGIYALEMACHPQDGFSEVSHQFCLLDILGLEGLQVILP